MAATDDLANERTFLAYVRTALALVGFGFVIARFGLFVREYVAIQHGTPYVSISIPLGVVMVVAGVATGVFGLRRYATVARAIAQGGPTAMSVKSARTIVLILILFAVLIGGVLLLTPT